MRSEEAEDEIVQPRPRKPRREEPEEEPAPSRPFIMPAWVPFACRCARAVIWACLLVWLGGTALNYLVSKPTSSIQQAALAAMHCFAALLGYAIARALAFVLREVEGDSK